MKKIYTLSLFLFFNFSFLIYNSAFAQAPPQGINYQAIARDASGNPIATQTITVQFIIHRGCPTCSPSCSETQNLNTNQFGLFTWVIGSSNLTNFDTISWGKSMYFLEVKVNTISMGSTQFMSVPYAFHAHTADSVKNGSGANPWTRTPGKIFPSVLSDSVGIGTSSPSGKLSVAVTSANSHADAFYAGHQGLGRAGVFAQGNPLNDSTCLMAYTAGKGYAVFGLNTGTQGNGGVFVVTNTASPSCGVIGSASGTGKGVFGINSGHGYAGAFMVNNSANDSAALAGISIGTANSQAVYGINMGLGSGGTFQIKNPVNNNIALFATTNGTGSAGNFSITNTSSVSPALYVAVTNSVAPSAIFTGGNVGIGTATPKSSLEVNGAVATTIRKILNPGTVLLDNTAEVWYVTISGVTLNLPPASAVPNRRYIIVSTGVAISITPAYYLFTGTTSGSIAVAGSIEIISDGTNWLQIK